MAVDELSFPLSVALTGASKSAGGTPSLGRLSSKYLQSFPAGPTGRKHGAFSVKSLTLYEVLIRADGVDHECFRQMCPSLSGSAFSVKQASIQCEVSAER